MLKKYAYIVYVISAIFMYIGFYKMFEYENDYITINAYVGGDAYNYIINSNYAIGYFVLALLFGVVGSTILIINKLDEINKINSAENKAEELE